MKHDARWACKDPGYEGLDPITRALFFVHCGAHWQQNKPVLSSAEELELDPADSCAAARSSALHYGPRDPCPPRGNRSAPLLVVSAPTCRNPIDRGLSPGEGRRNGRSTLRAAQNSQCCPGTGQLERSRRLGRRRSCERFILPHSRMLHSR